jgi:hypothetical protein
MFATSRVQSVLMFFVAELKDLQSFYKDLLRWQSSFVHLLVFTKIFVPRYFQNSGAYIASTYVTLVPVVYSLINIIETIGSSIHYRHTEIVPNMQLFNVTFEAYFSTPIQFMSPVEDFEF